MSQSQSPFQARRNRLLEKIGPRGIALLSSSPETIRNGDTHFPFRQDSDFYYLTGFEEPHAVAVFAPGRADGEYLLFNQPENPTQTMWTGPLAGQVGACQQYGANQSFSIRTIDQYIPGLLENCDTLYYTTTQNTFVRQVHHWLLNLKARTGHQPHLILDVGQITHEMRLIKDPFEINCTQHAVNISVEAHMKAMQTAKPGLYEYELEAVLMHTFWNKGARAMAYPNIVGSGTNSCILHYNRNDAQIQPGELILIDAGAEFQGYAADITRTFPASGRFSPLQKAAYDVVLATQLGVIRSIAPGVPWSTLEQTANRLMTEGLIELGLLQGNVNTLVETKAFRRFYMHRIGHWLGLDVHDVGRYTHAGTPRNLEPGMLLTVEPGLYISQTEDVDSKWHGIGIRIEDDVLVTQAGCVTLSEELPKTTDDIEALMTSSAN